MPSPAPRSSLSLPQKVLRYMRDPSVSIYRRLAGVWAVLYTVSPLDAVPDWVPLIGWLDDLGVVSVIAWFMMKEVQNHAAKLDAPPKDVVIDAKREARDPR
ncbi:MAG: YkvA family protein [Myxococcaceae bacterium]